MVIKQHTKMFSQYFIPVFIFLLITLEISAEWTDCSSSKSFEVDLEMKRKVFVYGAEIKIKYDKNELAVYQYPGLNNVNILINNTIVNFSGHILRENEELNSTASKISRLFNSKIAGSAELMKTKSNDETLFNCNLYLSRNRNEEELNIPKKLQVEIIHKAVACIKSTLCEKLGVITSEHIQRARNHPFNFGRLSVITIEDHLDDSQSASTISSYESKPSINANDVRFFFQSTFINPTETNNVNGYIQSVINKLVDLAIAELVRKIDEENQGKIQIPEINQNFSTGSSWWETTGEFNAYEGTFEDLTTISRTEDAILSHTGLKFIASCGFGLSIANMEYQTYTLRYGVIKVEGKLSASIDSVALTASVGIDYNQKPCRAVLESLYVSQLGNVKVKLTGLGPLNKLLSKLVTWITKKWQDEIVKVVEEELKKLVIKNLEKLNCERFRP